MLAADIVRRSGRSDVRFLMVGRGKEYPYARRLAERLQLMDNLLIMKPSVPPEQVSSILSALDVAVLPGSTDIICPIKVQEYMAAGLPPVVPDYPANREVVVHGSTGLLFRPRDEQSLAECLLQLAGNPSACLRMGILARETAGRSFSWDQTWGAALRRVVRSTRHGVVQTCEEDASAHGPCQGSTNAA